MKPIESRIAHLEVSSGCEITPPILVVSFVNRLDPNGEPIAPGELTGLQIHCGEFVGRIRDESREALITRATALAEPYRTPRCAIVLLERQDNDCLRPD